jgi:hypothetical protein
MGSKFLGSRGFREGMIPLFRGRIWQSARADTKKKKRDIKSISFANSGGEMVDQNWKMGA